MAYGDFKDSTRIKVSDKILRGKVFNIANNPKLKFFDKKTSGGPIKNENISNKELTEELHKPIIRNFKERKVHSSFIENIWDADLPDRQLVSKFNKGIIFYLLCVIDNFQ